jgi:hypothetical protein
MSTPKEKNPPSKQNLPLLRCECGHEILMIPDYKILGKAIEEHAQEHKIKDNLTQKEADAIQDNLIAQAFIKASEIETGLSLYFKKSPSSGNSA